MDPKQDGSFPARLAGALARVEADGLFSRSDTAALADALRASPEGSWPGLLEEPETVFGPFDALPAAAQKAISDAVAAEERWTMSAYSLGPWHVAASRAFWRSANRRPYGSPRRSAEAAAALALRAGPHLAVPLLRRRLLALAAGRRRASLSSVLAGAGADVRSLAVRYARALPQPARYRGFWDDDKQHTTTGIIVGLDFVRNGEGYWLIESNMDCGLGGRAALSADDPFVRGLVNLAAEKGYERLVLVAGSTSVDRDMARQFRERAAERKIEVEILESAWEPKYGHATTIEMPSPRAGTLLVRNRTFRTALDYLVHHKGASSRALRIYRGETGDNSFRLPATAAEPHVSPADPSDPFPNLVFKYPEVDDGEGVLFLKVDSAAEARRVGEEAARSLPDRGMLNRWYSQTKDRRGLWQSYVRTPWTADRRLFKIRAFVLLTPPGVHYIASHRTVCAKPVPEELPSGLVTDPEPYLVSYRPARGSSWSLTPPDEEPALKEAALGVARGLARALELGFRSRPG